jgi:probable addiction module antidote protein
METRKPRLPRTSLPLAPRPRTEQELRSLAAPYDPAANLTSHERIAALLDAALEDGDPRVIGAVLGDIARAHGMTQIAKETGLAREALYRALSVDGNPELITLLKVLKALGLQLRAV